MSELEAVLSGDDQSGCQGRAWNLSEVDEAFKDLKSLLYLDKLTYNRQEYTEKLVAMVLIAYCIGLWASESRRDRRYGKGNDNQMPKKWGRKTIGERQRSSKRKLYSGLFVLLKHQLQLPLDILE